MTNVNTIFSVPGGSKNLQYAAFKPPIEEPQKVIQPVDDVQVEHKKSAGLPKREKNLSYRLGTNEYTPQTLSNQESKSTKATKTTKTKEYVSNESAKQQQLKLRLFDPQRVLKFLLTELKSRLGTVLSSGKKKNQRSHILNLVYKSLI